jgi:ketosteroid isomerase-like protein
MSNTVTLTKQFLEAYNSGDLDRARGMMSDDIEIVQASSLPYGGTWNGRAAFEKYREKLNATWEFVGDPELRIYGTDDDCTFFTGRLKCVARSSGRPWEGEFVAKYDYDGDKLCRCSIYLQDVSKALEAIG